MSDTDATQARQDVVADVDEILEHIINANMLSMPYDVYFELFDAVAGIGVEIENLQAENAKLRELVRWMYDRMDESCAVHHTYAPAPVSYDLLMKALARARELGIEVDE